MPWVRGWPRRRLQHLALPTAPLSTSSRPTDKTRPFSRYESFEGISSAVRLSANPQQPVLSIFRLQPLSVSAWSDSICTGLQLVEHWQLAEGAAVVGRVYLPRHDMRRLRVSS